MKLPDGWHSVTPRIVTEDVTGHRGLCLAACV
jgi:hypothetical protein